MRKSPVKEHILKELIKAALNRLYPYLSQKEMSEHESITNGKSKFTREAINRRVQDLLQEGSIKVTEIGPHNSKRYALSPLGFFHAIKEGFLNPIDASRVRKTFEINPSHDNDVMIMWNEIETLKPESLYNTQLVSNTISYLKEIRSTDNPPLVLAKTMHFSYGMVVRLLEISAQNPNIRRQIKKKMREDKGHWDGMIWISYPSTRTFKTGQRRSCGPFQSAL